MYALLKLNSVFSKKNFLIDKLEKIIQTFVPDFNLDVDSKPFHIFLQKTVLFLKLMIDTNNIVIHGRINEDWFIADGLINLIGITLTLTASIGSENKWVFSVHGDILILEQSVWVFFNLIF